MSSDRPHIGWPVLVTVWCFIAAVYARKTDGVFIPVVATLTVAAVWVLYGQTKPKEPGQ